MMIKCKLFVNVVVDLNFKWGIIMWREFIIIDNVDKDIKWIRIGSIVLGDCIEVGIY